MPRRIITENDAHALQAAARPPADPHVPPREGEIEKEQFGANRTSAPRLQKDDYSTRILMLVPVEIVAAFITIDSLIRAAPGKIPLRVYWIIFAALVVLCFLYSRRISSFKTLPPSNKQACVSALSFAVWVFAIGGPFALLPWYQTIYGALLLPLYTLAVPLVMEAK